MAGALAGILLAACGSASAATGSRQGGLDDRVPDASVAHSSSQSLYLDVVMDGQVVRPLVRFESMGGQLSVDPAELDAIGILLPTDATGAGHDMVALADVPGLAFTYDPAAQQVVLVPGAAIRRPNQLGYRAPPPIHVSRDQGLVLDWDVYGQADRRASQASLGTGLRWFGRFGTLEASGLSRAGDAGTAYLRLDTRWTYSDPRRMTTWTVGDVVSGGLGWTRPVRLGGVQWRRDFGVRPDLITYPVPRFSASATVPSAVDLYVNNVRQFSSRVDPGPFVLSDFPRLAGAGEATVVVTDALGRTTQATVPLYVDYQRLARGLSDFSVEAGLLRRNYGIRAADYGHDVVASGSWRRGLTDTFTAEAHAEYGRHLSLAGAGLTWSPLARYGVVTANIARSSGKGSGQQYGAGYQWFGQRLGFDLHAQRASAGYRDIGALEGGTAPLREQDRASLWFSVPRGSLSFNWLRYRDHAARSRTVGIGFNQGWQRVAWNLSAFDDNRSGFGGTLGLTINLGRDTYADLAVDRQRGDITTGASVTHAMPYAGGLGWQVRARDNGEGQASVGWRGTAGEAWAGIQRAGADDRLFAQGNGSLVWMHGATFASRRITDAFAVVSTDGVAGVPVLYENRVAGRSNRRGYLLLTDLRGWQRNKVAIDPDQLDADVEATDIERWVTPADRGGVMVSFRIDRIRNASITLLDEDGHVVEAGTRVRLSDGREALVGFDGMVWLGQFTVGETLAWTHRGHQCVAAIPGDIHASPLAIPALCRQGTTE